MKYLTLFTIGPVQSFIAKARKLQDLYAGSFLLSYLSKQTMLKAQELGAIILFPDPEQKSAPNRFLMTVESGDTDKLREFCGKLETYVRVEWSNIAKKVFAETHLEYSLAVSAQIESLIQVYYASEEYSGGENFGGSYINAVKRLGSAKTLRGFSQIDEPYGRKCNLMYEYNALFYREKRDYLVADAQKVTEGNVRDLDKYIQPDETLSAAAFVKRCLKFAITDFNDKFPSVTDVYEMYGDKLNADDDKHGYYAAVMFDGDNMGMWYSEPDIRDKSKTEEFQAYLSREISNFAAEHSYKIVNWNDQLNGVVIYAGGEDFLGVLNIKNVFAALYKLRETFGGIDLSAYTDEKPSFSAGLVIVHVKTPLSAVLDMAREAEHKAKAHPGKDAFCLTIAKHSGEVTEFIQPFYHDKKSTLDKLDRLVEIIVKKDMSVKFIYQLGEELGCIAETNNTTFHKEVFLTEAERAVKHSEFIDKDRHNKAVKEIIGILGELAQDPAFDLKNLLMYLRAIAFIARERGAV
jgi:CRISPR-associated protein Cmr2